MAGAFLLLRKMFKKMSELRRNKKHIFLKNVFAFFENFRFLSIFDPIFEQCISTNLLVFLDFHGFAVFFETVPGQNPIKINEKMKIFKNQKIGLLEFI